MKAHCAAFVRWVATLVALGSPGPGHAEGVLVPNTDGGGAPAHMEFSIRVPQVLRLKVLRQHQAVEVSNGPGGASFASAEEAVEFEILSNSREYAIRFDVVDERVTSVEVDGMEAPLKVGPGGAVHVVPNRAVGGHRPKRHVLAYRIHYAPGTAPGPRPAPLLLSAQAP